MGIATLNPSYAESTQATQLAENVGLHKSSAQPRRASEHILGICGLVNLTGTGQAELFPLRYTNDYFKTDGNNKDIDFASAKITIIRQPSHGILKPDSRGDWLHAKYLPNEGYLGDDSVVIQVEGNGYKVKLHYFIAVTDAMGDTTNSNPVCKGEQGRSYWKISLDTNGNSILMAINIQSPTSAVATSVTDTTALAQPTQALGGRLYAFPPYYIVRTSFFKNNKT